MLFSWLFSGFVKYSRYNFRHLNNRVQEDQPSIPEEILPLLEKFPFLSYGTLKDKHYLGIVQNSDSKLLSMYVMDLIPTDELRELFLHFGNSWWWDSNRKVPISMFIKDRRFREFRVCLRHFSRKDFVHLAGPIVSLADSLARRVRKRQITLVRRLP